MGDKVGSQLLSFGGQGPPTENSLKSTVTRIGPSEFRLTSLNADFGAPSLKIQSSDLKNFPLNDTMLPLLQRGGMALFPRPLSTRKISTNFEKIVFRTSQQCMGACFASHISAVNRAIRVFIQRSMDVRHVYGVTKHRGSTCENAPTTTGQNCDIVRYPS